MFIYLSGEADSDTFNKIEKELILQKHRVVKSIDLKSKKDTLKIAIKVDKIVFINTTIPIEYDIAIYLEKPIEII